MWVWKRQREETEGPPHLICGLLQNGLVSPPLLDLPCSFAPPNLRLGHTWPSTVPYYLPGLFLSGTVLGQEGQCGLDTGAREEERVASPSLLLPPAFFPQPSSSPALLPTSPEGAHPALQATVPALMTELDLRMELRTALELEQAEMCRFPQGLSQAGVPPAELLLPLGKLQQQQVTLLQVGPALCWGHRGAQSWEWRQDLPPHQVREGERREMGEAWGWRGAREGKGAFSGASFTTLLGGRLTPWGSRPHFTD